jgi:hypothetical protein
MIENRRRRSAKVALGTNIKDFPFETLVTVRNNRTYQYVIKGDHINSGKIVLPKFDSIATLTLKELIAYKGERLRYFENSQIVIESFRVPEIASKEIKDAIKKLTLQDLVDFLGLAPHYDAINKYIPREDENSVYPSSYDIESFILDSQYRELENAIVDGPDALKAVIADMSVDCYRSGLLTDSHKMAIIDKHLFNDRELFKGLAEAKDLIAKRSLDQF